MTTARNGENLRRYKNKFSLIIVQILTITSSTTLVRNADNMSPNSNELHNVVDNFHSDR